MVRRRARRPIFAAMRLVPIALLACVGTAAAQPAPSSAPDTLRLAGLGGPVEIVRDTVGINHIYAGNEHDLFFAQGYAAARDRMFQLELWRRQATGTVAELLGAGELARDRGSRLFMFRGDMDAELAHYHPRGRAIVEAFVAGVNARVAEVRRDTAQLPIELKLLGALPGEWTPAVVVSRHQGLVSNVTQELAYGRAVAAAGPEAVLRVAGFHPGTPAIALDSAVNGRLLDADILAPYAAFRAGVRFTASDLAPAHRADAAALRRLNERAALATRDPSLRSGQAAREDAVADRAWRERHDVGSNNWVLSGSRTASGEPLMANDPHRTVAVPSLRYWVHLVAPGWNVIGGGEPSLPGVSIGHNEHGAWGLTVFNTDGEDLYVYETNPANPREYRHRGAWERMREIVDTIRVKGAAPEIVTLRWTRHGPVVHEDTASRVAYAVRAAWLEVGSAPYLASLRIDQARTWDEFRDANRYSHLPGENMIWADTGGTIGWQAVGLAPVRPNWSGLVPVPGDGRYEWDGFLPMLSKPNAVNPASGFIATANNDVLPPDYPHRTAVGYAWADPFRFRRIVEVLDTTRTATPASSARLQTDYASLPARALVPLLARVRGASPEAERVRTVLLAWDRVLDPASVGAGAYAAWIGHLTSALDSVAIPAAVRPHVRSLPMRLVVEWMVEPPADLGATPAAVRDAILVRALDLAAAELVRRFGADTSAWRYGQPAYKHAQLRHTLSTVVPDSLRATLDVGPLPRGGDAHTVGATGGAERQSAGATFRIVVDVANWDAALGTSAPGQSGDPRSPFYRNLFAGWAADAFFPVAYTRPAVDRLAHGRTVLLPE